MGAENPRVRIQDTLIGKTGSAENRNLLLRVFCEPQRPNLDWLDWQKTPQKNYGTVCAWPWFLGISFFYLVVRQRIWVKSWQTGQGTRPSVIKKGPHGATKWKLQATTNRAGERRCALSTSARNGYPAKDQKTRNKTDKTYRKTPPKWVVYT